MTTTLMTTTTDTHGAFKKSSCVSYEDVLVMRSREVYETADTGNNRAEREASCFVCFVRAARTH